MTWKWIFSACALSAVLLASPSLQGQEYSEERWYDNIANSPVTVGDEIDQQQWYNPADWFDSKPAFNYFSDEYYERNSGRIGALNDGEETVDYRDSAWDESDYWREDWDGEADLDWNGDFDWNHDDWWD